MMDYAGWAVAAVVFLVMLWVNTVGIPAADEHERNVAIANATEVVWRRATAYAYPTPTRGPVR